MDAANYFYCCFSDSESSNVVNILGSVLAQLCEPDSKLYQNLDLLYDERSGNIFSKPIRLKLNDLINLIIEQAKHLQRAYILSNAINECGDSYKILQSFETITKFSSIKNHYRDVVFQDIWDDVHLYVVANLEAHPRLWQHSPNIKAKFRQTLADSAQ